MSVVELALDSASAPSTASKTGERSIMCLLVGGPAQLSSVKAAAALAKELEARLTAVATEGRRPEAPRMPVPIGGGYWLRWLERSLQAKGRDASDQAQLCLEELEADQDFRSSVTVIRRSWRDALVCTEGHDLVVVPAEVDEVGLRAYDDAELSERLIKSGAGPVLRVGRWPTHVARLLLVLDASRRCSGLSRRFLQTHLWPSATVVIFPLDAHRSEIRERVRQQVEILKAHGRTVEVSPGADSSATSSEVLACVKNFNAAVLAQLSCRPGAWLGAMRTDVHALVAASADVTVLP